MATRAELSQVASVIVQWEQLTNYTVNVTPQMQQQMADAGVETLYDVGQWMYNHGYSWMGQADSGWMPWATYGMRKDQYYAMLTSYFQVFQSLTGVYLPPPYLIDDALRGLGGQMTASQWQTWLLSRQDVLDMYPWLKFGYNRQQFDQYRLSLLPKLGYVPDLTQGIAQLQWMHAAEGSNMWVAAQPTFTQLERKQAQAGPSQSVVR
jgi:hypothetical protein